MTAAHPVSGLPAHRVLVTGSAGAIGRPVCRELRARGHFVRGFDLKASPVADEVVVGSIVDAAAVEAAMEGITAVVHLAAEVDDCDFISRLIPANYIGAFNVLDAARRHKVQRLAIASSGQVYGPNGRGAGVIPPDVEPAPMNQYAISKVFLEHMSRMIARQEHIPTVVGRIAWLPRTPATVRYMKERNAQAHYLSQADAGRFFACAIEAANVEFAILFVRSKTDATEGLDMAPAKAIIGYEPQDRFPEGLDFPLDATAG